MINTTETNSFVFTLRTYGEIIHVIPTERLLETFQTVIEKKTGLTVC